MNRRGRIFYDDRSGKLLKGLFWRLDFGPENRFTDRFPGLVYSELSDLKMKEAAWCPVNRKHVTGSEVEAVSYDLFGGALLGDFVEGLGPWFITKKFGDRLAASKLSGFRIDKTVHIAVNQSKVAEVEPRYLTMTGRMGPSQRLVVENWPNVCPHCKKVPMVCAGCGQLNAPRCSGCGKITMYQPHAPDTSDPAGFEMGIHPKQVVLEAKGWDGSDFIYGDFVSNRAKEWMESTHTFPVSFKPALLNVEGVEEKFNVK